MLNGDAVWAGKIGGERLRQDDGSWPSFKGVYVPGVIMNQPNYDRRGSGNMK